MMQVTCIYALNCAACSLGCPGLRTLRNVARSMKILTHNEAVCVCVCSCQPCICLVYSCAQLLDTKAVGVRREKMYRIDDNIACAVAGITGAWRPL